MKKMYSLLSILFFAVNVLAQNVGVGTTTPTSNFEVKKAIKSTVKISSANYFDTSQLIFSNRNAANAGTDMLISSNEEYGLRISSKSDFSSQTKDTIVQITPQGNVGIRNAIPQYPLDVKGDINTTGLMLLNGDAGLTGQVLTSNGISTAPTWEKTAFSNNTRFSFSFTSFAPNRGTDSVRYTTTRYNTNSADVFINASQSRITIAKTGLYHFEIGYYVEVGGFTPAYDNIFIIWDLVMNTTSYGLTANFRLSNFGTTPTTQFFGGNRFSIDLYCTAGSNIKLVRSFNPGVGSGVGASTFSFGDFTGYLISE
jgi:hypothetical protein